MDDLKGRKLSKETFNRTAEVKPWVSGARADSSTSMQNTKSPMFGKNLMEEVCGRSNLQKALKRVIQNKGSAGVDGMTVAELPGYLKENWLAIKELLLKGDYTPIPVKRVEIPKPGTSEKRKLGIPCVLDRFIQQAILQGLQPKWDATFSECSYGFRPGRSCHQAIAKAQEYLQEGFKIVVDIDLEKFFDRVCHDRLMSKLADRIEDKRALKLIRRYMTAGIMEGGLVSVPTEGTPQGGPLSPFLSNVVLDELDKELEMRGHKFVRYADDCNIYTKSERAGERIMSSITSFITRRLKLKVNADKSAVDKPQNRKFLGFSFTGGGKPNRRKIAPKSLARFRAKVRSLTRRNRGKKMENRIKELSEYLTGWRGYYGFCETPSVLRDLDSWIRRRLRCIQWKQWKRYRKRKAELVKLGVPQDIAHMTAWSPKGPWRMSYSQGVQMALTGKHFEKLGLPRLISC